MTDPGPRMRDVLRQATDVPTIDRARAWAGVRARRARLARRRSLARWSLGGLLTALGAAAMVAVSRLGPAGGAPQALVPVATDSIAQSPSGAEPVQTQQETPSALIPLLGHRTQLRMDIDHLTDRRRSLTIDLANERLPAATREVMTRELAETEQQLAGAKQALAHIDAQLGGPVAIAVPPVPEVPGVEHITTVTEVPVGVPVLGTQPLVWIAGAGALITLMIAATLMWVRRTTRATLRELAALRTQSGTQLTTLTEGVEAIALEVERIGEGQRYLSKLIGTPQNAGVEQRPAAS